MENIFADDVIFIKNGYVTDASFANLVFFNGSSWITPATPLLRGTMRERLIHQGIITEQLITAENVLKMKSVKLINAMNDFDTAPEIPIERILC
jgi:4-amino-4-deoxychorismate lyase